MDVRSIKLIIIIFIIVNLGLVMSFDKYDFLDVSCSGSHLSKTYELYYDDGERASSFSCWYENFKDNEPFENGFGFYFDLDDFDFLKNVDEFEIIEIRAYIIGSINPEPRIRQVLCAGVGGRTGPKGPDDVFFAVPDDGISTYEFPFEGWIAFTEKDGSWGTDDGAKYDYNGLPYRCIKEKCKNEHGYWLWVALTQVLSDGEYFNDYDQPNTLVQDDSVSHHYFRGENYNWYENELDSTGMIRLKVKVDFGHNIDNSSIGMVRSLFH
ncbi:MAG: hypothetical protein ACUVWP_06105 [bacterium]